MKKWCFLVFILIAMLSLSNKGIAQITAFSGGFWPQSAFSFPPRFPAAHPALYSPMPFLPLPLVLPPLPPSPLPPLIAPMSFPRPILRSAAATITIIFNPTVSIVNVSAIPITTVAPTVLAVPTAAVPPITPTASLLPLLLAAPVATGPPYSYNPTATPSVKKLTTTGILGGLTALLPLLAI